MQTIYTAFSRASARLIPRRRACRGGISLATVAVTALALAGGASAAVPANGRAWELVTPPDRNAAAPGAVFAVSPNGERLAYGTLGPMAGAQAGSLMTPSFASRSASGWTGFSLALPYSTTGLNFQPPAPVAANEDMSYWVWSSSLPLTADGPPFPKTGLYGVSGSTPTLLADTGSASFELSGASADARRVVFQTGTALLPADVKISGKQVYEIGDAGLRLVGVDGAGVPLSTCGAIVGSSSYPPNPISRDGRRIFVASPDASCGAARRKVYLREDGATTEISASRCARVAPVCNAPADVRFMGATPSGSVAFLATAQQLTDDDTDGVQDLYRYDVADGTLSRVSAGSPGAVAAVAPTAAYPSADGARVYFVANGALVPGEGAQASPNIYVSDDRGLRFVATIRTTDSWRTASTVTARREDVQLTADGDRLVFLTTAPLTADDTDSRKDVYLYDASDDALTRVSGASGGGNGGFDVDIAQTDTSPALQPFAGYPRRSLSDDGRHVFFRTDESLLAEDSNANIDVYEWHDGDLGLVTSGRPHDSVRYGTASADGQSVFFTTDESLTVDDDDGGDPDLYVARVGGGFPGPASAPPPAGCECEQDSSSRLKRGDPDSVGFTARRAGPPDDFGVLPISPAARRRMAVSGWLALRVRTAAPGRISVRALARLARRSRTVARGQASATRAGTVALRLRLSSPARRRLDAGSVLRLRVELRRSRPHRTRVVRLELEQSR